MNRTAQRGMILAAILVLLSAWLPSAHAAPSITTFTASMPRWVDQGANVWGTIQGQPNTRVWTEVKLPSGDWSRSQLGTTTDTGFYAIALTYGSDTPGSYTYRVGVRTSSGDFYSDPFSVIRSGEPTANAADSQLTDVTANAWGWAPQAPGATVFTQVLLDDGWSTSQIRTTDSAGTYIIPLTYGQDTAGTYTWRVGVTTEAGTRLSPTFTQTRVAPEPAIDPRLDLAREQMWDRIAQCESGGNWSINTGNGYYGGLQFNLATWRSVGGGDFAAYPHQATREEQITVANRLYAQRGTQPWPSCGS